MEHRADPRLAIHQAVLLRLRGKGFLSGVSRDISAHGMFVELQAQRLRRNAMVEVELPAAGLRIPALVAHCRRNGVGLIFDEAADPLPLQSLRKYLRAVRAARH